MAYAECMKSERRDRIPCYFLKIFFGYEKMYFCKQKNSNEYADCYDEIGWESPLIRAFMCNYTLNGMYRRFLNAIGIHSHRYDKVVIFAALYFQTM